MYKSTDFAKKSILKLSFARKTETKLVKQYTTIPRGCSSSKIFTILPVYCVSLYARKCRQGHLPPKTVTSSSKRNGV